MDRQGIRATGARCSGELYIRDRPSGMYPLAIRQIRDHYITGFSESKHFFEPAGPPRENPTAAPYTHPEAFASNCRAFCSARATPVTSCPSERVLQDLSANL